MRPELDAADSGPLSQLIYQIAAGNNYSLAIANQLNATQSPIARQLNRLVEQKYLFRVQERQYNRVTYTINYQKINDAWLSCIEALAQKKQYNQKVDRRALLPHAERIWSGFFRDVKNFQIPLNTVFRYSAIVFNDYIVESVTTEKFNPEFNKVLSIFAAIAKPNRVELLLRQISKHSKK